MRFPTMTLALTLTLTPTLVLATGGEHKGERYAPKSEAEPAGSLPVTPPSGRPAASEARVATRPAPGTGMKGSALCTVMEEPPSVDSVAVGFPEPSQRERLVQSTDPYPDDARAGVPVKAEDLPTTLEWALAADPWGAKTRLGPRDHMPAAQLTPATAPYQVRNQTQRNQILRLAETGHKADQVTYVHSAMERKGRIFILNSSRWGSFPLVAGDTLTLFRCAPPTDRNFRSHGYTVESAEFGNFFEYHNVCFEAPKEADLERWRVVSGQGDAKDQPAEPKAEG